TELCIPHPGSLCHQPLGELLGEPSVVIPATKPRGDPGKPRLRHLCHEVSHTRQRASRDGESQQRCAVRANAATRNRVSRTPYPGGVTRVGSRADRTPRAWSAVVSFAREWISVSRPPHEACAPAPCRVQWGEAGRLVRKREE